MYKISLISLKGCNESLQIRRHRLRKEQMNWLVLSRGVKFLKDPNEFRDKSLPATRMPAIIRAVTGVSCSRKAKTVANTDEQPKPIKPVPNQRAKENVRTVYGLTEKAQKIKTQPLTPSVIVSKRHQNSVRDHDDRKVNQQISSR